jgi:hypothetical protein
MAKHGSWTPLDGVPELAPGWGSRACPWMGLQGRRTPDPGAGPDLILGQATGPPGAFEGGPAP